MAVSFEQYWIIVKRYALALTSDYETAEDLAQETMLRAIKHQKSFSQIEHPRKWLLVVVTNLWRDRLRHQNRQPSRKTWTLDLADDTNDPQKIVETEEQLARVLASFDVLPNRQRQVLYLRTVEGYSVDEVSEILKISRASVKSNLSIARKTMREKHLNELAQESK